MSAPKFPSSQCGESSCKTQPGCLSTSSLHWHQSPSQQLQWYLLGSFFRLTSFILSTSRWTTATGHMTQQNDDAEPLAFRRSKNRLVDCRFAVMKSFRFSIYLPFLWCIECNFQPTCMIQWLLVSPKIIKLTILDLAWSKISSFKWHCLDESSQVERWIHHALPALFTEFSMFSWLKPIFDRLSVGQKGAWMLRCALQTADLCVSRPKVDFETYGILLIVS